jgi:hypothetical protein
MECASNSKTAYPLVFDEHAWTEEVKSSSLNNPSLSPSVSDPLKVQLRECGLSLTNAVQDCPGVAVILAGVGVASKLVGDFDCHAIGCRVGFGEAWSSATLLLTDSCVSASSKS